MMRRGIPLAWAAVALAGLVLGRPAGATTASAGRHVHVTARHSRITDGRDSLGSGGKAEAVLPRRSDDTDDTIDSGHRVEVVLPHVTVDDDGELVRVFSDVEVPEGKRVDGDVVAIFGSSRIDGHVTGNAVSVCGSVKLGPHATVDGDMVAILGMIDRAPGATVGGESVDVGLLPPIPGMPTLPSILLMVGLICVLSLFGGWIVTLVMPLRLLRITATASRRTTASLLLGLVSLPLAMVLIVLLCITVIGIPVAGLLPIAFVLMAWIGQYAGLYGLGLKLLRRRLGEGSMIAALAAGTLFVSLFFVVGALLAAPPGISRTIALFLVCVGGLFGFALSVIGMGAVVISKLGSTPEEVTFPAEAAAAPLAAPPASAAPPIGA